jgi:hypothetical protein
MSDLFENIEKLIDDKLPRFADNKNVKWIQTGENTWEAIVKVPPARSESTDTEADALLCRVTGGSNGVYSVDVYDEYNGTKIGSATAMPLMLHFSQTIPSGTWIIAPQKSVSQLSLESGA